MFTKIININQKVFIVLIVFTCLSLITLTADAMTSQDEAIDISLGALEGPISFRILIPPGSQEGASLFPPFKQEPPASQQDFRQLIGPVLTPTVTTPTSEPKPGPAPSTTPTPTTPKPICPTPSC